mgnify:CR=1 FL=1
MDGLLHQRDRGCGFLQLQVGRTGDVDQCAMRTLDAFLQQRRADGDFRGLRGAVLSPSGTDAEQRGAGTTQNRVDIVEINVDVRIRGNQVGDALHAGQQCGVGGLERVDDANGAVGQFQQSVVRNDDQRVDFLAQVLDAERGGSGTLRPSKLNGRVTTAMVSAPCWWAARATIGLAPVPVPPPSPQVTNTMSEPLSASSMSDW